MKSESKNATSHQGGRCKATEKIRKRRDSEKDKWKSDYSREEQKRTKSSIREDQESDWSKKEKSISQEIKRPRQEGEVVAE